MTERLDPRPALVVGGTGMLTGVVHHLVGQGRRVAVVARDGARIAAVAESGGRPDLVLPVACDYADTAALRRALARVSGGGERFGLAVCWVHSPHRDAVHAAIAESVAPDARVVDVWGSAAADPSRPAQETARPQPWRSARIRYGRVVLGFTDGPGGTRWLSHDEISAGVVAATAGSHETTVVGRVRPWSERP